MTSRSTKERLALAAAGVVASMSWLVLTVVTPLALHA